MDEKNQKEKETIYKIPKSKLSDEAASSSVDAKYFRYDLARFLGSEQEHETNQRLDEQTVKAFQGQAHEFEFDR